MSTRGKLTPHIAYIANKTLNLKSFGTTHLRLLPYIHYCVINHQNLDNTKLSDEEQDIITQWKAHRHIVQIGNRITVSRKFYNAMNDLIWLGYIKDTKNSENRW